jgi:hypothetical protein
MLQPVLQRLIGVTSAVLLANALWAAILPSTSGRIVGAGGALIALLVLVAVWLSDKARSMVLANPPGFLTDRLRALAVVVPFVLPGLFLRTVPVLAFWRFDGRSALLVAWLISIVVAITFESDDAGAARRPSAKFLLVLFLIFSSGLWLAMVMDTGIPAVMIGIDRRGTRSCQMDLFTTIATVWQTNPPSEHLFLAWRSQDDFQHRLVYSNHVHPFLLSMYGWVRAAQKLGHLRLWQASNTTILLPIFVLIAGFITLLARNGALGGRARASRLLALFLAMGILLTTWRLWIDLIRFDSDNPYPLLAGVLVLLYALLLPPLQTRAAAIVAALFAALSPTITPLMILPVLCLFGARGQDAGDLLRRNRSVMVVCLAAIVAGAVSYLEPRVLIRWYGYQSQQSSLIFRSGLDGDTRYFSGLFQAAVAPCPVGCCYARSLSDLLLPSVVPLTVLGPLVWSWSRSQGRSVGRAFLFLVTPYLMSVIFFPQSVSIHPYLYDHWFIIPVVVSGLLAMLSPAVEERLNGAGLLTFLLFVAALLMSNFLGVVQGLARAITFFTS